MMQKLSNLLRKATYALQWFASTVNSFKSPTNSLSICMYLLACGAFTKQILLATAATENNSIILHNGSWDYNYCASQQGGLLAACSEFYATDIYNNIIGVLAIEQRGSEVLHPLPAVDCVSLDELQALLQHVLVTSGETLNQWGGLCISTEISNFSTRLRGLVNEYGACEIFNAAVSKLLLDRCQLPPQSQVLFTTGLILILVLFAFCCCVLINYHCPPEFPGHPHYRFLRNVGEAAPENLAAEGRDIPEAGIQ